MADLSERLRESVQAAFHGGGAFCIVGGGSKNFYGRKPQGEPLRLNEHRGIVDYEPTELVVTARGGTPLTEIDEVLAQQGQTLAFEPPRFSAAATLGGSVAAGLSGPRRPFAGALRDFVLGCRLLDGRGGLLNFGGRVMKNVAGYDVSRLMAGALGTLGVLLEISLKVLPKPVTETTLVLEIGEADALARMNRWAARPLPLSGLCFRDGRLYVRLSGSSGTVSQAARQLGGDVTEAVGDFWEQLRDQRLAFFHAEVPLWRLSIAPALPPLPLSGRWLYDWGGAQRWLLSDEAPERVFAVAREVGGHATLFRGGCRDRVFQPLPAAHMALQRRLKQAFDPAGLFNRGRLYREW